MDGELFFSSLLGAAQEGKIANCCTTENRDHPDNDPFHADEWSPEREVRAELIRWLCTSAEATRRIDSRGIQLLASKVTGELDLAYVTVTFPIRFERCRLCADAKMEYVSIPTLNLDGSCIQALNADGADVKGDVVLREGSLLLGRCVCSVPTSGAI